MKSTLFALACIAGTTAFGGAAFASCSEEEVQAKALEVSAAVQELATTDLDKMQTVMAKMQENSESLQSGDLEAACEFYDGLLEEINS